MGDREATLNEANLELIDALLPDYLEVASLDEAVNTSDMMETEPWGFSTPVEPFLNQSFCCLTELEPQQVLEVCQRIETELGRERKEPQFDAAKVAEYAESKKSKEEEDDDDKGGEEEKCPKCGKFVLNHRVCKACGYYKGEEIVSKTEAAK